MLLIDKPTNQIDKQAVFQLEKWLNDYRRMEIVTFHDKEILDHVVGSIIHIEKLEWQTFMGNHSSFEKMRYDTLSCHAQTYEKKERRRRQMQGFIDWFDSEASRAREA